MNRAFAKLAITTAAVAAVVTIPAAAASAAPVKAVHKPVTGGHAMRVSPNDFFWGAAPSVTVSGVHAARVSPNDFFWG